MADSSDIIEVVVTAEQRVFYMRTVRMPKKTFDAYEAMCDEGVSGGEIDRAFEDWVDTTDVCDSNDIMDVTFQVVPQSPQETSHD